MHQLRIVIITLLIVSATMLLAFGPRAYKGLPKDRVVVEYWEKWTGAEGQQLQEIVDEFNTTDGVRLGIYVNCVSTSEINKKTLVAIAAGVPPDIAGLWDYSLVPYASLDALLPLEDMAKAHGIDEHYYKPVYWKICNWNNHLYGLVSTPFVVALHYNKTIFAECADQLRAAGLDPDRAPETLDELDRYAAVFDKKDATGLHILRAGQMPLEPGWAMRSIPNWFGVEIWNEKTEKFQLTDPRVIKAFDWIASYSRKLGKDATAEIQATLGTSGTSQNAFFAKRVVMEQQGPWMANFIRHLAPQMSNIHGWTLEQEWAMPIEQRKTNYEWAAAPWPSAVPGMKDVTLASCDVLTIPRGAKHVKEAFEFIAWMNSQRIMEKLCQAHSKNSPLTQVSADFIQKHSNPYIDVFERLAASPNAFTVPRIPIYQEVYDELLVVIQQVALLKKEPKDALADAQVRLQASYDTFMEKQRSRHASIER